MAVDELAKQLRARAEREATKAMRRVASAGSTITYSELTQQEIAAFSYAPNSEALGELSTKISRWTNARRGVLLSAVVVHAEDALPGKGFFELASSLGRDVKNERQCRAEALRQVHHEYATRGG